ncbi:MAG TPA: glycosyltransferase family 2 protein [Thermoanaerobaculia bacterium]|nr:glycosyltransferase family 2 protein [Thermoanaerobaculia bacterium]
MEGSFRPVALVPAYQAEETVGEVVNGVLRHVTRVVVVDDGSTDATSLAAARAGAEVIRLPDNCGKGSALRAGLARILASEATHVAFVDADGQHDPDDLPPLLDAARRGDPFVIGSRMSGEDGIPAVRFRTNEIGSRILTRMTGLDVEDGQSGYRVIAAPVLRRLSLSSKGYSIETEILLKAAPHVPRLRHVPVRAIYSSARSHYKPFRDTWIISWGAVYYKVFEVD